MSPKPRDNVFTRRYGRRAFLRATAMGVAGLTIAGTVGCSSSEESSSTSGGGGRKLDEVRVGQIWPLTGTISFEGTQCKNAVDLFVEQFNAAGGFSSLGGAKLTVVTRDTESKPDVAIAALDTLVQSEKVSLIHGAYQSGAVLPTTERAARYNIPYFVTGGLAQEILERGLQNVFRWQAGAEFMGRDTVRYLKEIAGRQGADIRRIVYLHEDSPYGSSVAKYSVEEAQRQGFEVVETVSYKLSASDLTSELLKVRSANPDVLMSTGYLPDGVLVTKTLGTMGYLPKYGVVFNGSGGLGDPRYFKEVGQLAENMVNTNSERNPKSELTTTFEQEYQRRYNDYPAIPAVIAYVGMQIIADAIERAASDDPEAILKALRETSLDPSNIIGGQLEPVEFDEKGQNKNAMMIMYQARGGKSAWIWPGDFAKDTMVFPFRPGA